MRAPQNNIFVEVESKYNDEVEIAGGKKLFLTTQQYARDEDIDALTGNTKAIKPVMMRRHYGTVIGLPISLTEAVKIRQVDPGFPAPGYLSGYKYKWITNADFEMEVEMGDKIYFHHNTVHDDNLVEAVGTNVYRLEYQNAVCSVRNGKIFPVAGNIIVEPVWEEGVVDLGDGKRGKLTKSGLVSELHDKPEPLHGRVVAVCSPMKGELVELEPGDKIVYLPYADYEVEIEGRFYYVMKYWEVLAKYE